MPRIMERLRLLMQFRLIVHVEGLGLAKVGSFLRWVYTRIGSSIIFGCASISRLVYTCTGSSKQFGCAILLKRGGSAIHRWWFGIGNGHPTPVDGMLLRSLHHAWIERSWFLPRFRRMTHVRFSVSSRVRWLSALMERGRLARHLHRIGANLLGRS